AAIADADLATLDPLWPGSEVLVLVRAPWDEGPCARILARGTTTPGWFGALLPADPLWLLPVFAVLFGVALAAGPAVRRIQRLAARVRRSAEGGFSEPVALPGDDEIAELSRAFDRAATTVRDQLRENQRREQALREFVANTTHDVMTPLTVLADHLTTLRERAESGGGADLATVAAATAEVQYLGAIIENLGLAAKLDASAPTCARAPVELDALVDRVVSRHQTFARARDVALAGATLETPARTLADVTMLEQALSNLVHNAIRYNAPGGHVAVLLERPAPGRARLRVIDDGPGIPDEAIARLLQRGARSDEARTREPGGQGLGLSIALRVAALHNMTLELGRSEHGGLRVDLTGDELEPRRA
ncbi:MAG: HAMP domain-containing protein, partial [Myxococcales bacterium]|nr:HAMP domain-containing protein [Myxococcales bacterium]